MVKPLLSLGVLCILLVAPGFGDEPLAILEGKAILESDIPVSPEQRKLEQQLYQLQSNALSTAISTKLLEAEAERRGVTVDELVAAEINPKMGVPTSTEIANLYNAQKDKINRPLKEVRDQVIEAIQRAKANVHLSDLVNKLREDSDLKILLDPPRLPVDLENVRFTGPESAPVTVVEYSDFQCPFCRKTQPVLTELREQYGDLVRWGFKDLPLTEIHPEAMRAAHAARCANEQGEFWAYRAKLFEQELFTDAMYQEVAEEVGVNGKKLMECLDSGKYTADIEKDAREARLFGIEGTPAFLINGALAVGALPIETFQQYIRRELPEPEDSDSAE